MVTAAKVDLDALEKNSADLKEYKRGVRDGFTKKPHPHDKGKEYMAGYHKGMIARQANDEMLDPERLEEGVKASRSRFRKRKNSYTTTVSTSGSTYLTTDERLSFIIDDLKKGIGRLEDSIYSKELTNLKAKMIETKKLAEEKRKELNEKYTLIKGGAKSDPKAEKGSKNNVKDSSGDSKKKAESTSEKKKGKKAERKKKKASETPSGTSSTTTNNKPTAPLEQKALPAPTPSGESGGTGGQKAGGRKDSRFSRQEAADHAKSTGALLAEDEYANPHINIVERYQGDCRVYREHRQDYAVDSPICAFYEGYIKRMAKIASFPIPADIADKMGVDNENE